MGLGCIPSYFTLADYIKASAVYHHGTILRKIILRMHFVKKCKDII